MQCKWVLRKKYDSDNNVGCRARLVAKGFTQKHGVDYAEAFSPVVRHTTFRLLFALSVQLGLDVTHLDVKTAFLNGGLEETIFMQKPDCYGSSNTTSKVLKLKNAIYGPKQVSRAWNKKVDSCLIDIGHKLSKLEPCMYIKNCKTIVTVYVDDFFVFSNDKNETKNLKDVLVIKFKIKDLGQVRQCLGMNVSFNNEEGSVTLSQESYIEQLLNNAHRTDCKTVESPMECKLNINEGKNFNNQVPNQQLLGSLMYLSVLTRPDILTRPDNRSAQKLSANPVLHKRSKHIDVKYFCGECVHNKVIKLHYLSSSEMPADIFTKALSANKQLF